MISAAAIVLSTQLLTSAVQGSWSGSCQVIQDQIFRLPPAFSDQLEIGRTEKAILMQHQVRPDASVDAEMASKISDLLMIFIQGPADLSTGDANFHYFEYVAKPGDTPSGIWKGYTMNNAIAGPDDHLFQIENLCVLGDDAQAVFNTKGAVGLSQDGRKLEFSVKTDLAQSGSNSDTQIICTYQRTR